MTISVQTAVGSIGGKATTELSYAFGTLVNTGTFQYGFGADGISLLNTGEQDNGVDYERSFTLASTDMGLDNLKRLRFIYIGAEVDIPFTLSVMGDNKVWRDYDVVLPKAGLQEIFTPIGHDGHGSYWKLKITSTSRFRIDRIRGMLIIMPLGRIG